MCTSEKNDMICHRPQSSPLSGNTPGPGPASPITSAATERLTPCRGRDSPGGFRGDSPGRDRYFSSRRSSCSLSSCDSEGPLLPFSIANILRPDFGVRKSQKRVRRSSSPQAKKPKAQIVREEDIEPPIPKGPLLWPAWVYCTRYSDRPSSGPRSRRINKKPKKPEEKRPRTAFTPDQLGRLKREFEENRYLSEKRRQDLSRELNLNENQIKIWFQNKRAKIKKTNGNQHPLAMQLMAEGLYNHATVPVEEDEDYE